jgi:hypothetical protein
MRIRTPVHTRLVLFPALLLTAFLPAIAAETEYLLREGVAVATGGRMVRTPFHTDPVEARIVAGTWTLPVAGETLVLPGGTNRIWEKVTAKEDGSFEHAALRGGYFEVPYVAEQDGILLLRASGHTMAYVNGEPRAGDVYGNNTVSLPIAVRRGTNDLLFATARGGLRVRLAVPAKPLAMDPRDPTLPDRRGFRFSYRPPAGFKPTDIAELPDGRLLVLNRRFTVVDGFRVVLTLVEPGQIAAGRTVQGRALARFAPPLLSDNFEGIAMVREANGGVGFWIVSDDNQSRLQQSLLLKFRIVGAPGAARR